MSNEEEDIGGRETMNSTTIADYEGSAKSKEYEQTSKSPVYVLITDENAEIGHCARSLLPNIFRDCRFITPSQELLNALEEKRSRAWGDCTEVEERILRYLLRLLPSPHTPLLQISRGVKFSIAHASEHPTTSLTYMYNQGSRLHDKDSLKMLVDIWVAKKSTRGEPSLLEDHMPLSNTFSMPSCAGEPDFSECLEEEVRNAIEAEAYELCKALETNETLGLEDRQWWILKPSTIDGGKGIKLFSTWDDLVKVFQAYDRDIANVNRFTAQHYIRLPMLLDSEANRGRKFHIRTYAIAARMLDVYVYHEMLVLFASAEYTAPWISQEDTVHLTNSSLREDEDLAENTTLLSDMHIEEEKKRSIVQQIHGLTKELFDAAATQLALGLRSSCFQIYGLDFLVDERYKVWLLEVNENPVLKQERAITMGLITETFQVAVEPFFDVSKQRNTEGCAKCCRVLRKRLWSCM